MAVPSIVVVPQATVVRADRRLAFEVLTAFGVRLPDGGRTEVLRRDSGGVLLVCFTTPLRFAGRNLKLVTEEEVRLEQDRAIQFNLVCGRGVMRIFALLDDRFVLEPEGDGACTRLVYESSFALRGGWLGWLAGRLLFKRLMQRFMVSHLQELRSTIELRASRSRVRERGRPSRPSRPSRPAC